MIKHLVIAAALFASAALAQNPTNSPAPQATTPLLVHTNGAVVSPSNFVSKNWSYPEFYVALGSSWTDFEIKASTNNFQEVLFWFKSTGTNSLADDPSPRVWYTDSGKADPRAWNLSTNHTAISLQIADTGSIVRGAIYSASLLVASGDGTNAVTNSATAWMHQQNSNLVWSVTRYDGIGFERDVSNRVVWCPIQPVWSPVRRTNP